MGPPQETGAFPATDPPNTFNWKRQFAFSRLSPFNSGLSDDQRVSRVLDGTLSLTGSQC